MTVKIKSIRVKEGENKTRKTRMHFFDEDNVIEELKTRYSKPYKLYRTLFPEVLKKLRDDEKFDIKEQKIGWSQKAGCSCGCSPGFIFEQHRGFDIYIDIEKG